MPLPLVHHLHYGWTGWPCVGEAFPALPDHEFWRTLDLEWQHDGLTRISLHWLPDRIQMAFRVSPHHAPVDFTRLIKGRLDHACRSSGYAVRFSRKVAMRCIGHNTTQVVNHYLREQVARSDFADPRYAASLEQLGHENASLDLKEPASTNSGRYWH